MPQDAIRHNWTREEAVALFELPLNDLLFQAHSTHREFHDPNAVQVSTLLSIKTGGCPEDCSYCPQSAHFDTPVKAEKLMQKDAIMQAAQAAKDSGASRFCMGAAWRSPKERDMAKIEDIITSVKGLGLETCATLGMVDASQAQRLKNAGLDYYNHNIDSSEAFYPNIITTRSYQDRLDTLENVRASGMSVCCGGILGMGETVADRAAMLVTLANLSTHPESVPINRLVQVEGTGLNGQAELNHIDFVRSIAVARIMMPASSVRLSAGREDMSEAEQALCFFAGANSIFYGEKLLTTDNPSENEDMAMFSKLGLKPLEVKRISA